MTIMTLKHQILIIHTTAAHNGLLTAAENAFRDFETAVAGSEATADVKAMMAAASFGLTGYQGLHETMRNEWDAFARTLETAYGNFSRDVVHRIGFDEQAQVRNLARNTAAGALTRIRERARAHLTQTLESIRD
jgi:hypothetical protein